MNPKLGRKHLWKMVSEKKIKKISQSETRIDCGGHV
jgi:hypothetical protein